MKVFLGVLLLCVTCLSALAQNYPSLEQYCEQCLEKSAISGYYQHPIRCDAYIHCQLNNHTIIGHEQFCGEGTCFNNETLNCDYCSNVKCQNRCDQPTKLKNMFSCNKYYKCDRSSYEQYSCPRLQRFDEETLSCVPDIHCPEIDIGILCSSHFKLSSKLGKYWQMDIVGWIERDCSPATAFDMDTCTCSKIIPVTPRATCMLVDLPLTADFVERTTNWYVENVGNVEIYDNSAQFSANSALVIPALTNNDLGQNVAIEMKFMIKSFTEDSFAIVSNGNCKRDATIAIRVENAKSSPEIVGSMKIKSRVSPVRINMSVRSNVWYSITFSKLGNIVRMTLNDNPPQQVVILDGSIEIIDSALSIGKACEPNAFIGSVNTFKLTKCPK